MLGQIYRFGITGLFNTIIDFCIFNGLVFLSGVQGGFFLGIINAISVAFASANSFFLNRGWTFRAHHKKKQKILLFMLCTLTGLALNSVIVVLAANSAANLPFPHYMVINGSKIIACLFSAAWNFTTYHYLVFPAEKSETSARAEYIPDMVSVIIPAYNEESRLPSRLEELAVELPALFPVEIIVVDDGSIDGTLQVAKDFSASYPFISCLSYSPNRGKGRAVQTGMLAGRGEYLVYTDADHTFSVQHIAGIVDKLKNGNSIAAAFRQEMNGKRLEDESLIRRSMGRIFRAMVRIFLLPGYLDTQCGLKGFHCQAAGKLFPLLTVQRFAFDIEVLALARASCIKVEWLPVKAKDCAGSTVNFWLSPLQMIWDLFKIKLNLLTNGYDLPGGNVFMQQAIIAFSLFILALAVRIPWLWEIPRFIDELKEVSIAYQIYTGNALPLHNAAHDIGAFHNYMLAFVFKILGPSIYWPRLYVAVTAALTVVLVYSLGKKLYGSLAAFIAAGLLLTNGMHILVTHMAWSNCSTPFFFILALIATMKAEQHKSGSWLIISALLWALTLQTHSSIIIYIMIILAYVLSPSFRHTTGISNRYYWGSVLAFTAGYINMLYFNLITLGGSFRWLAYKTYALENNPNMHNYLENLQNLIVELMRSLASIYSAYNHAWGYLFHPLFLSATFLLLIGIRHGWKNSRLLIWLLWGGILAIPLFNERYVFYVSTRYIMPLLIISILLVSCGISRLYQYLQQKQSATAFRTALVAPVVLFIFLQVLPFYGYCHRIADTNASNRIAFNILDLTVNNSAENQTLVIIDEQLPLENKPLPYLLTIKGQPFTILPTRGKQPGQWLSLLSNYQAERFIAVMTASSFEQAQALLKPAKVTCLTSHIIIPEPRQADRKVFVVEIDQSGMNSLYTRRLSK